MAILPDRPGLEVHVLLQGQELIEYQDEHDEEQMPHRVVRYIEAVSGAEFGVQFELKQDLTIAKQLFQFRVQFYVDGRLVVTFCYTDRDFKHNDGHRIVKRTLDGIHQMINGVTNKRRLKFADIKTDDHSKPPGTALLKQAKQIGEIRLEFTKGTWESTKTPAAFSSPVKDPLKKVFEKVFKGRAVSHQAAYGPPIPMETYTVCNQISRDPEPFAIFVFRYKSRDALQAEGIIPRSPSPLPPEARPVETLSAAELQELVRRQKITLAKVKSENRLKRERASQVEHQYASSDTEGEVEEIERPAKFRRVVETIDLSSE